MKVTVDGPYYNGKTVFDSDLIEAVYFGTNGDITFLLKGGSKISSVQNDNSVRVAQNAGFYR